jgi:hypothetical protein
VKITGTTEGMKKAIYVIIILATTLHSCAKEEQPSARKTIKEFNPLPVTKTNDLQLFAHYMPWFEDKSTSGNGNWGWHWTMSNQNPDIILENNQRQIASHYYPIIGPYASSDPDLIEYHLLLMKYSGIDGILIDWYGTYDVFDYALNKRNTEALLDKIEEVGLKFAIVYEDATIRNVLEQTSEDDGRLVARMDMLYMQEKFFSKKSYITIDNKPLLLVFGPNYFTQPTDWDFVMSVLTKKPCLMPLWGRSDETGTNTGGEYIWVDLVDVDEKYATATSHETFGGGAWPGFHDFYKEGGAGDGYFYIDHSNGSVWRNLLQKANENKQNIDFLQLITWNDFGEGTIIEPTIEFGYSYLMDLQNFTGLKYDISQLKSITTQYNLRKKFNSDKESQQELDQAFYYWVSLQDTKAKNIIDSLDNLSK